LKITRGVALAPGLHYSAKLHHRAQPTLTPTRGSGRLYSAVRKQSSHWKHHQPRGSRCRDPI